MKIKHFFALLAICVHFFTVPPTSAQSRWEPVGNIDFRDAYNFGGGKVAIAASSGSLYWSSDDGVSFHTQLLDDSSGLNSIAFQGSFGIAGSDSNHVFLSSDAGATWTKKYLPSRYGINYITFAGTDTLFACGNRSTILRSTDRGETWSVQSVPGSVTLFHIKALTSQKLFINADSGYLYSTIDGGAHWNQERLSFIARGPVGSFDVAPNGEYLAAGGDSSLSMKTATPCVGVSMDGGATWKVGILNGHMGANIFARFLSNDTIVAFQSDFFRYVSTDNGTTWDSIDLRTNGYNVQIANYSSLWHSGAGHLMVCGDYGTLLEIPDPVKPGSLLHAYAAGITSPMFEGVRDDENVIHGIGSGNFVYSLDGGTSWVTHLDPNFDFASYNGLHFTNDSSGVVLTVQINAKTFWPPYSTTNNGATWQKIPPTQCPHEAWFYNTIGSNGDLFMTSDTGIEYSTDNGLDWSRWGGYREPYDSNADVISFEIAQATFFGMDTAYLHIHTIGNWPSDVFLVTYDLGQTWKRSIISEGFIFSMAFISPLVGMFSLEGGQIYRTSDGGTTWNPLQLGPYSDRLWGVCFNRTGTLGVTCGDTGFVAYTLDSGQTWHSESVPMFGGNPGGGHPSYDLTKVFAISDSTFLIQGTHLYRKSYHIPSALSSITPVFAQSLSLQSYPNPCHDVLNVEGASGKVTVLDALGRTRDCPWQDGKLNVVNLPAGIYYLNDGHARAKFEKE